MKGIFFTFKGLRKTLTAQKSCIQNFFEKTGSFIRERLFPSGCAVCEKALFTPEDARYGLCPDCRTRLLGILHDKGDRCQICGKPLVSEVEICMACRRQTERVFDKLAVIFPYYGDCQKVLRAYKFGSRRYLGNFLAECLAGAKSRLPEAVRKTAVLPAAAAASAAQGAENGFVWVPVPPRPGKFRKAGWDQVEYLARILEKRGFPISRCLRRLPSGTQKVLGREERRYNLRGKIIVKSGAKVPEKALLFDDVLTTGSTINACAEALKAGGSTNVEGICLFYD